MKSKTETLHHLTTFCNLIKRQFNKTIKKIRSDNGRKFVNSKFLNFVHQEGIIHETYNVYTPQQNGRVKRKHRHILNIA